METIQSIAALQVALATLGGVTSSKQLIHNSDRGIQYCSCKYVKLLQVKNVRVSMTEIEYLLENAIEKESMK